MKKKSRLEENFPFLHLLSDKLKRHRRSEAKKLFHNANNEEIVCLLEIISNFLAGNYPSPQGQGRHQLTRRLRRQKKYLRGLILQRSQKAATKRGLVQRGGAIFSVLLPPLIAALVSAGVERYV